MQNYEKSATNPLNFFKNLTSTGKNTGPSPLSLVGVSFNKAVITYENCEAEPRKNKAVIIHRNCEAEPINSGFLSTLWRSGYREQIEPDLQRDSFQSNTTANVHCLCPTFNRLSRRFDIGVRFRFNVGGDVSSAIVGSLDLISWAGLEFSASRRLLRSSDIGVSLLVSGGGGSS